MATASEWIDVTYPIHNGMIFNPMDPLEPRVDWVRAPRTQHDLYYLMQLTVNPHNGTHIDANRHFPAEFVPNRRTVDEVPWDNLIGSCRVIEIADRVTITREELETKNIQDGERLMFKTRNTTELMPLPECDFMNFVALSAEAARYLVEKETKLAGIDYVAIAGPALETIVEGHSILFNGDCVIMELLDLSQVSEGNYEMIALPIRVVDGDASWCRVLLRPVG